MRNIKTEKRLKLLSEYMNEFIDAWPRKIKPFEGFVDSRIDKRINLGVRNVIEVNKKICKYCRRPFNENYIVKTKDHIIPVSRGGFDRKENRVPCCSECNFWKADKLLNDWLSEVKNKIRKNEVMESYDLNTLRLMVSNIKRVMDYVKENQKKISLYKVI